MHDDAGTGRSRVNCGPLWFARALIVAMGLGLWFLSQSLIGSRAMRQVDGSAAGAISSGDVLFTLTSRLNELLHAHPAVSNALLFTSSGVIDALGVWLIVSSVFGSTMRPFLGLLILFALRQISQTLCVLPAPEGMIWHDPGWPSLLVTYHVANDFFFSGHTAIAVFGGLELSRLKRPGMWALGIGVAVFEMATVIVLRAHYSIDVFTGAIAALWASCAADQLAPRVDRWIAARRGAAVE